MALGNLIELSTLFVKQTAQLINLMVSFLNCSFVLGCIDLRSSSILEILLQRLDFLLFQFHLPYQLLKFIAIHSAPIFFLLQLLIFPLEILQHLLQLHILTMQSIQLFLVIFNFIHIGMHLILNLWAKAALAVHLELVKCLLVLVF
jgi:hypothetical protein